MELVRPPAESLILFFTGVRLTVATLDGNRIRTCCKAALHTSLLLRHQTELFRTHSLSNLHLIFHKTLKNVFGNILMLYLYFHISMGISQQHEGEKKCIFSSWKYPGKQGLLGPLTFLLKHFEYKFLTSPSVVLFI